MKSLEEVLNKNKNLRAYVNGDLMHTLEIEKDYITISIWQNLPTKRISDCLAIGLEPTHRYSEAINELNTITIEKFKDVTKEYYWLLFKE